MLSSANQLSLHESPGISGMNPLSKSSDSHGSCCSCVDGFASGVYVSSSLFRGPLACRLCTNACRTLTLHVSSIVGLGLSAHVAVGALLVSKNRDVVSIVGRNRASSIYVMISHSSSHDGSCGLVCVRLAPRFLGRTARGAAIVLPSGFVARLLAPATLVDHNFASVRHTSGARLALGRFRSAF